MSQHQGLVNEGATCYLNSLIQTLFMTYEFRQNVYTYIHDPKKIAEKDSIPYQLQKLFVNLQTKDKPCYTSGLLKSFQWEDGQAFEQHDVQEFCRLLFEAIQLAHKDTAWIKQLFEGTTQSCVDCGKHKSVREQLFMDIALPIRDQYTLKTYNSIEESLRDYLKPEKLEDKFLCEQCGQKVFVEKYMTFGSIPPILTLQLNRFELNYETFQREKINSFFYFPQILEMHRFMKPHKDIQIKQLPKNIEIKTVTVAKEVNPRAINFGNLEADKPLTRKKSDDKIGKKETVTYFDEENKDKRAKEQKDLSKEDEKMKHLQILASLKSDKNKFDKKIEKIKEKQLIDLDNDMLFGMTGMVDDKNWAAAAKVGAIEHPTFEKKETKFEHEQQSFDPEKQYPDLTYALYSVLVHAGGSYGGHYFAYISDGFQWYKFDDASVSKVKRSEIRQYGVNSNSNYGTNAYLLFYRDVKTFKDLKNLEIPKELLEKVKLDEEKLEQLRKASKTSRQQFVRNLTSGRAERLQQLSKAIIVRVFKDNNSQAFKLTIPDKTEETINTLRQKIKEHFQLTQKQQNWRLRRYNKSFDAMYEVYDAGEITLGQLDLGDDLNLAIEYKKDEEVFEPYDPRKINVKVCVWQPDVSMILDKKKKIIKISILEEQPYEKLYNLISKVTGITNPLVIKRNFSRLNPIEKLKVDKYRDKQIIQLRFFNNIQIYVEEDDSSEKTKWQLEFENQRHRCLFKFNNPIVGQQKNQELYFDTRKTLGELKTELSKVIGLSEDNFRIKKGKNSLSEMTTYKKKLSDLRFINTQFLYIEEGVSSKGSVIVHRGEVELVDDKIEFKIFEEFVFELGSDLLTVDDLCKKISERSGIPANNIRVREYRNYQFKEIFTYTTQIHSIRQKSLVWQLIADDIPKGLQIYFRTFDIVNFQFGDLKTLYADSSSSYEELAFMIEEETGIQSDKVLVWKPLSNYVEKQFMLDVQWTQIRYIQATLKEEPLLIRTDGDIIIIKQADKAYQAPKGKKTTKNEAYAVKGGEKKLKITVIAENENPSQPATQPEPSQSAAGEKKQQISPEISKPSE